MTPLEAEIRAMIALDGPITVERYMALCLSHPVHGYYLTREPLGAHGDFITAPEISQMFGELIGLWAAAVWQRMGEPKRVSLVELGPGRGTLMADALRAAAVLPGFASALAVELVETSPTLRARQQTTLESFTTPIAWHRDVGTLPERPAIIIANEFFDALPIHQAVKDRRGWRERMVGIDEEGHLAFAVHPDPIPNLAAVAPLATADAPEGALVEWRSDHIATELARRLTKDGGAALVIDYGYTQPKFGETLQAVRHHAYAEPLEAPGDADLTALVDFTALAASVHAVGAAVHGPVSQGDFLRRLGIELRAERLKAQATSEQASDIESSLARLTQGGEGMGELFKALAIADPSLGALPGFET